MPPAELYWSAEERLKMETGVLRDCLQSAIVDTPFPFFPGQQGDTHLIAILSPFLGSSFVEVRRRFQSQACVQLAEHGIGLTANSPEIVEVSLPPTFLTAYRRLESRDSDEEKVTAFVQDIQDAARALSPSSLLRLRREAMVGTGWILDIFARGTFKPAAYIAISENTASAEAEPVATPSGDDTPIRPVGEPGAAGLLGQLERNLPLTPQDMALLRQLPPL
jgi:hypothetical protein